MNKKLENKRVEKITSGKMFLSWMFNSAKFFIESYRFSIKLLEKLSIDGVQTVFYNFQFEYRNSIS